MSTPHLRQSRRLCHLWIGELVVGPKESPPPPMALFIGILESGATRTIVTGETFRLLQDPREEIDMEVSTAAHRGDAK